MVQSFAANACTEMTDKLTLEQIKAKAEALAVLSEFSLICAKGAKPTELHRAYKNLSARLARERLKLITQAPT